MDREIPIDEPTRDDAVTAMLTVKILLVITESLDQFDIPFEQLPKVTAEAIVGMMRIGEKQLKGVKLLDALRVALDNPDHNWTRFNDETRA